MNPTQSESGSQSTGYPCDGCSAPDSDETLWLAAPLGLTAVHVCRSDSCALVAKEKRGGGRFVTPPAENGPRLEDALR